MIFSSAFFLFAFLPIVAIAYACLPWKNTVLLIASLFFYAWGEPFYIALLVLVCLLNWYLGLHILPTRSARRRKAALTTAVALNVVVLLYFKYAGFVMENNAMGPFRPHTDYTTAWRTARITRATPSSSPTSRTTSASSDSTTWDPTRVR